MSSPPYLTEAQYTIKALHRLEPGETYVYFVGFLDEERLREPHGEANQVAEVAYRLAQEGKVYLTQKRIGLPTTRGGAIIDWNHGMGKGFRYIATGARHIKKPPAIIRK